MTVSRTKMSLATTFALACLLAVQSSAKAQDFRSNWSTSLGGVFAYDFQNPGRWVESTHVGTTYTFSEVYRNGEFIELHDPSRALCVRLGRDACFIQHVGTRGRFDLLYYGGWR